MRILAFAVLAIVLIGCSDRRSLETYQQSRRTDPELITRYQETNSATEEYVNRVAKRVMSVSDRSAQNYNFQVEMDADPILNIDPESNTIIITKGALRELHDEATLAATLTLCMEKLDRAHNVDQGTVQALASAGYDPHALLDLQERYVYSTNRNNQEWLAELFANPPTASTIQANKLLIDKLPPGGSRGREHYLKMVNG